jgi:hypothetical protein
MVSPAMFLWAIDASPSSKYSLYLAKLSDRGKLMIDSPESRAHIGTDPGLTIVALSACNFEGNYNFPGNW